MLCTWFLYDVPHYDAEELRPYIHHVMALFSSTAAAVDVATDRSGIQRVKKLSSTLVHEHGRSQ